MYDSNAVKIYTDGSAKPNPGKGGVGIVVEYPDSFDIDNFEISEGYKLSNNNRMELKAVITALEWLQMEMKAKKFTRAIIVTDSDYVYSNHSNAQYWKANKWRTQEGKPYENEDLWDSFLKERQKVKLPVEVFWTKGKKTQMLMRVDALAKQGADRPSKTDYGYRPGKIAATRTGNKKGSTLFPAKMQEEVLMRVYRKNIYGKNENQIYKITFDVYDEVKKSYMQKYVAYQGKECGDLKRNNCYRCSFNNSESFPLIEVAVPVEYVKDGT